MDNPLPGASGRHVPAVLRRARCYAAPRGLIGRLRNSLPEGRAIAEEVWQRRHRGIIILIWLHVPVIVAFGLGMHRGLGHSIMEAGLVAGCALAARHGPNNRRFRSLAATLGLTMSSAILVHLSGGVIELHFHYFFSIAVVSLYHDWTPFLAAISFVTMQHGVMGVISPHSVYNHPDAIAQPWKWASIHGFFVLIVSAVSLVRWKSSETEALMDPLTRLPNRALFGDRLKRALLRRDITGNSVSAIFLDIDEFKSVNDTAGHEAGDHLLIAVAERLRKVVRPMDTAARLGGDEFAIVLEEAGPQEAIRVAQRIIDVLREPLKFDGRQLSVTASIGIAVQIDEQTTEAELIRNADIAMYAAKRSGKACYALFEPSMHRAVLERAELADDLKGAVERGEFRILYQPIVAPASGIIAGFEALLRWVHPTLGLLGPARFITLAEETGDILDIGRWVLESVCKQAKTWEAEFRSKTPRWVSVNVSVRQMEQDSFVNEVIMALRAASLEPHRLILEITESAMVDEHDGIVESLHRLKRMGVGIALDDFGTGYSSLGRLRRLPIDILKIDKSFVDGIDQGPENAALARSILKIAEHMGLQCIAEGVEREEQVRQLSAAGCKLAQGYFFSKAVEARQLGGLLSRAATDDARWLERRSLR